MDMIEETYRAALRWAGDNPPPHVEDAIQDAMVEILERKQVVAPQDVMEAVNRQLRVRGSGWRWQ